MIKRHLAKFTNVERMTPPEVGKVFKINFSKTTFVCIFILSSDITHYFYSISRYNRMLRRMEEQRVAEAKKFKEENRVRGVSKYLKEEGIQTKESDWDSQRHT